MGRVLENKEPPICKLGYQFTRNIMRITYTRDGKITKFSDLDDMDWYKAMLGFVFMMIVVTIIITLLTGKIEL